ncbi:hypothetical protein E2I00_006797, partial [Balaenoptera physalus]
PMYIQVTPVYILPPKDTEKPSGQMQICKFTHKHRFSKCNGLRESIKDKILITSIIFGSFEFILTLTGSFEMGESNEDIDQMFSNLLGEMDLLTQEEEEAQAKADKIKLALEKLKEAKVKKLVVKVHMNDNSTKSLMVDERQLARDVLDNLFEKTHCDCNVDWCLYEIYPELQIERFFEDHENVVEVLSDWTRDTENKVLFLEKEEKYAVFKNPQQDREFRAVATMNFYLDNKGKKENKETNEKMNAKNKESLLETPNLKQGLKNLADEFAKLQDYRQAEAERLEAEVVEPLQAYGTTMDATRTTRHLEETTNNFEKQKTKNIKTIFSEFITIEMLFHGKALDVSTTTYQNTQKIDEEDLERSVSAKCVSGTGQVSTCQLRKDQQAKDDDEEDEDLDESFCGTSIIVPELEGALYLKEDGKKSWKRRYFLLRASGIYYVPKGKTKTSRDLACFIQFENVNIYYGIQCKMKYKAPTDYCFVLKHPQIQKESQYIKYLCCDDARMLNQWVTGIRIAKYGKTLYDNYQRAMARAGLASRWTNLGTVNAATPAPPSTGVKTGTTQANGQIPQAAHSMSTVLGEAQRHVETTKLLKSDNLILRCTFSDYYFHGFCNAN